MSLLEWYIGDEPLPESSRKPQKLSRIVAHKAQNIFTLSPFAFFAVRFSSLTGFLVLDLRENLLRFFGSWKSLTDRQRSLEILAR
jgi:hypothetical protein